MQRWWPYLLVGLGGFFGANARYLVARFVSGPAGGRFPLGTFVVNVSGSFLLGFLGYLVARRLVPNGEPLLLALGVGFLGAYTTFSTFEYETHALFEDGLWTTAAANILLSVLVGLVAVRAGVWAAKAWFVG